MGWKAAHKHQIRDENRTFKHDLVAVKGNKAILLDLTIVFEDGDSLRRAYEAKLDPTIVFEDGDSLRRDNDAKVNKYQHMDTAIREGYDVTEVVIRVFAIGCQGFVCLFVWLSFSTHQP